MAAKVEIYTTQNCPYCIRAKTLLKSKKVAYTEILVDEDPEKFDEMMRRSQGARTVPQIFINEQSIGGFDDLWKLEKQGKLNSLLS